MGGKTFGIEARRLTTPQHAALYQYVKARLDSFTPYGVRTNMSPGDKIEHGDLDVMIGSHAEGPGFKYQFAGQASDYANLELSDYSKWRSMSMPEGHQWTEAELKDWIKAIARDLEAVVWQKHRIGAIFAVPCHVIGQLASEAGFNECYQVDLNIVVPERLDFGEFILSYGITPLFVNQVIKQLSPALKIHHEHLVLHHSPYPGEPAIHLELTGNAAILLEWLGLDYERWKKGFDTQDGYQRWLAGLSEEAGTENEVAENMKDSRVRLGWTRLIEQRGPVKDTSGHQKERIEKLENFIGWLRSIGYSSGIANAPESKKPLEAARKRCIIRTDVSVTIDPTTGEITQDGTTTTTIHRPDQVKYNRSRSDELSVDPISLDDYAIQILEYFGKREVYELQLEERRSEMVVKVENRRRILQNRDFAMVNDSKTARDIKRAEGRWT